MHATAQTSGRYLFFRTCATAQPSRRFLVLFRVHATGCTDLREVPLYLFKVYAAAQTSVVIDLNCRDLKKVFLLFRGVRNYLHRPQEGLLLFQSVYNCFKEVPLLFQRVCNCLKKVPLLFESVCCCLKEVPLLFRSVYNCPKKVPVHFQSVYICLKKIPIFKVCATV